MRNRKHILTIFDRWLRQPAKHDLIRTAHGTAIYFEGLDHGHWVCFIGYQYINLQNTGK